MKTFLYYAIGIIIAWIVLIITIIPLFFTMLWKFDFSDKRFENYFESLAILIRNILLEDE